nr:glucose transporter type 1-like [Coffea arabica]
MEEGLLSGRSRDEVTSRSCSATLMVVFSTAVAACGSLAYGFAVGYSSPAESGIMHDLDLSIAEYSVFGSILTFAGMVGALISGKLSDFFGRRVTMWILEMFFIVGWILIMVGKNAWWLDAGRFLMGIGAGLHCYVAPIYIAEITPKNIRGAFTAVATFTVTCGFSIMFFIGNFLTWRSLAIFGVMPSLVHILGVFFIPESPRWLAKIGKEKAVELALRRLRGKGADIFSEAAEIKDYTETAQLLPKSRFLDLFDRKYAHPLIVGVGLMVLVQFGGTDGVSSYASSIFEAAGCSAGIASTVMATIQLPFASLSVLLMDKAGRRPILMFTAAGSCIGCFLVGLGFFFKDHNLFTEFSAPLALTGLLIYSASFSAGMGGTPWVIMSEIFPINIKGTGGSLVTLGNWFSSWIVTYAFNYLFEWSASGVFFVFSIVCALIILFTAILVPETKGRTLEEIQESMALLKMKAPNTVDFDEEATSPLLESGSCDTENNVDAENEKSNTPANPLTPVVIFSTSVSVLGSYVFGTAVGFSSPAQSVIMNDLGLSTAEYSLFSSILTIGAMFGAILSGKIADAIGRKYTMWFSELFCTAGYLVLLTSESALWLDIGRISTGFGIGILSYVVPVYIAEITPKNHRGAFTILNQVMICCGHSTMLVIGNFVSWRMLALIGSIPCLLQLLGLFFIPESPRWLAKIDRWKECEMSLQRLRGADANISGEAIDIRVYTETLQQFSDCKLTDLFNRKYAHAMIVGLGLMAFQQAGGVNTIAYYASSIFESAGCSGATGTMAMASVQLPMTILGSLLVDKSGRIPLLMVSAAGSCFGWLLVGLSFLLQDLQLWKASPILALIGALIFVGSFSLGMGGIPWVIMSEVFPIHVKGLAGSLVTGVNWLGSWLISYSFNFLVQWITSEGTFFMYSIITGLTLIFVKKLVPETKGRTLEEIQASLVLFTSKN